MLFYTSPAAPGTYQFNLTFIPEFFTWNDAGVAVRKFSIETQEDGVLADYNAPAIAAINGYMFAGAQAANQVCLRIADGHIADRNVTVTVTIAAAAAISFYGSSDNIGSLPYLMRYAAVLALNPTEFKKFTAIFIPELVAATSRVTVEFADGHKQIFAVADLLALSAMYQQVQGVIVNNIQSYIHRVTVESKDAATAYILSVKFPIEQ